MIQLGARPAAGFDDPIQMLSDCHRRIEWFLESLYQVVQGAGEVLSPKEHLELESALSYFATSGIVHTHDEDESLFPRLRACADQEPHVQAALEMLERLDRDHQVAHEEHEAVETLARTWLTTKTLDVAARETLLSLLESLQERYRVHIRLEDSVIFPLACTVLPPTIVKAVGEEMRERHTSCLR